MRGTRRGLGSCTRGDCARAQSCLLSRGISVTQLNPLVRQHYLLKRKAGAGRGALAARRFAHHYVPFAALKWRGQGSSGSPRARRRRAPNSLCLAWAPSPRGPCLLCRQLQQRRSLQNPGALHPAAPCPWGLPPEPQDGTESGAGGERSFDAPAAFTNDVQYPVSLGTHRGWSSGLCRLAHCARPARAAPNPRAPSPLPAPGAYSTSPSSLLCPRRSPFFSHPSPPVARIPPSLPWLAGRLVPPGAPMSPSHRGDPQQVPRAGSSPGGRSPPRCGFPPAAASQPPLPNVWGEEPSQAGGR